MLGLFVGVLTRYNACAARNSQKIFARSNMLVYGIPEINNPAADR